jgi:hypothetical protein
MRLKEHMAINQEKYLIEFIGNRKKSSEQQYQEVYFNESNYNAYDQSVYNLDDDLDFSPVITGNRR